MGSIRITDGRVVRLVLLLPLIFLTHGPACNTQRPEVPFEVQDTYFPLTKGTIWNYVCEQVPSDSLQILVSRYVEIGGRWFAQTKESYSEAGKLTNQPSQFYTYSVDGNVLSIPFVEPDWEDKLPPSIVDSTIYVMYAVHAKPGDQWNGREGTIGTTNRWGKIRISLLQRLDSVQVRGRTYRDCLEFHFPDSDHGVFAEHELLAKGVGVIRRTDRGGRRYSLVEITSRK